MIVISYGMTKSGSTLAFELCKAVLEIRGFPQRRLGDDAVTPGHPINFLNDVTTDALRRAIAATSDKDKIVIKVHAAIDMADLPFVENAVADNKMKVQVNLRDPREVCLSLVDAGKRAREQNRPAFSEIVSLADSAKVVSRQLGACRRWGSIVGAQFLFYNEVGFETPTAIKQICSQFALDPLTEEEIETVHKKVFKEAFTQKNKAKLDRYKDDLTVRQNEFLLTEIRGGRGFINRVCDQRDFTWFSQLRTAGDDEEKAAEKKPAKAKAKA